MAQLVLETTGSSAGLIFKERRKWDTNPKLLASIEKAKNLINYNPIVDFKEGFYASIEKFKANWKRIDLRADFPPGMSSAVR